MCGVAQQNHNCAVHYQITGSSWDFRLTEISTGIQNYVLNTPRRRNRLDGLHDGTPAGIQIALPAKKLAPALRLAPYHVARTGKSAVTNIWTDPNEYAPGTKNQTRYK
jgi:hypothetical protein